MCFKTGLAHLEQNQLPDALSCFDEAFLALAKDHSRGADVKAQATICAQYKIAVTLLQVLLFNPNFRGIYVDCLLLGPIILLPLERDDSLTTEKYK